MLAVVAPEVVRQDLADGECVLLHQGTEEYFSLDAVGARMLDVAVATDDVDQAVGTLVDEYDADVATLRTDLSAFLDRLEAAGLIQVERG